MSGGPTTWFSGKSAPEDQKGPNPIVFIGAAFFLYSPIGAVVLICSYIAFNYYRVSHRVIAGAAALYTIPFITFYGVFSSIQEMFRNYHAPLVRLVEAIKDKELDGFVADNWWYWFAHQFWLSLALGLIFGAVWTSWKWVRRPAWEDNDRVPGPIHRLRRRKAIKAIASDTLTPADGGTLGVDTFGAIVLQLEAEGAAHTICAGGSGSGKTTTMMVGIRDKIRRGEPVCVVDLKGAADLPVKLAEWSERYGRRFLHWSITDRRIGYTGPADGPAFYDPIGRGDPSRKKDLLIGSEKWDVEYYKSVNENYLQTAFKIAELVPSPQVDAFTDLAALLDIDKLKARTTALFLNSSKTPEGQQHASANGRDSRWWEQYPTVLDPYVADVLSSAADLLMKPEESERSAIRNMAARVQKLRQSTAGSWLKRDPEHGRDIDLRKVADEGWVVVFSLDSSNYEATSAQVGGLIIQDLKTLTAELRVNPAPTPMHVYVDEFSAIGSDNILGLLARGRDARMPCTLSTQALADLKKADPAFLDQALGIVNSFIIHRANTEADAEIFAGLTGKKMKYVKRYGVEMTSGMPGGIGTGSATGQGHIEQQEDYVVLPSEFQALKQGQMVYIAKSPNARVVYPVDVIREDPDLVAHAIATGTAPTPTTVRIRATTSPFSEEVEAADKAFPSPWPVMATDVTVVQGEVIAPSATDPGLPAALEPGTETSPVLSGSSNPLQDFDNSTPFRAVEVPKAAKPPAPRVEVDPSAFLNDFSPPRINLSPATPDEAEAVVTEQFPAPATPVVATSPAEADLTSDEPVFGGGNIEWEESAPTWDAVDRRLPLRPPTPATTDGFESVSNTNLPTTREPDQWREPQP